MLNAANLALVAFSRQLVNIEGQLFALMSMTVAAAEAVVGLAILVDIFRVRDVEDVDDLSEHRQANHGLRDRKSTRLNSSHRWISYAVFCLKKKTHGCADADRIFRRRV